jgi:hypothetical protein
MSSRGFVILLMVAAAPLAGAAEEPKQAPAKPPDQKADAPPTLAEQVSAIKKAQQEREKKFLDELRAAKNNEEVTKANKDYQSEVQKQITELKALIEKQPADPGAFEGILVLAGDLRYSLDEPLRQLVDKHHLKNPKMGRLCFLLMYPTGDPGTEKLLKEVAADHPVEGVRGQALYALGMYHRHSALPYGKELKEEDKAKELAEAERCFQQVAKDYAALQTPDGKDKLGDKAVSELTRIKNLANLKVGGTAPEIRGEDIDGRPMKLADYQGKVVVLDFWGHW